MNLLMILMSLMIALMTLPRFDGSSAVASTHVEQKVDGDKYGGIDETLFRAE